MANFKSGDIVEIHDDVSDSQDAEFLESLRGKEMTVAKQYRETNTMCEHYKVRIGNEVVGEDGHRNFFPFIDADLKLKKE